METQAVPARRAPRSFVAPGFSFDFVLAERDVRRGGVRSWAARMFWPGSAAILLGVTVALQWWSGAYRSELGLHPDEAAHYVNGLVVFEYLRALPPGSPLHFVEQYYGHYPKVSIGHWPPLFYVLEGLWSLLVSPSVGSALFLVSLISAALAAIVAGVVRHWQTAMIGLLTGLLFAANPVVLNASTMVMADGLVALMILAATLAFFRYIERGYQTPDALVFGVVSALAFLTKGNAVALVAVPPLTLALLGRWGVFKKASFWVAPMLILALAGPWYWFTRNMQAGSWVESGPILSYAVAAVQFYLYGVYLVLGPLATVLASVGITRLLLRVRDRSSASSLGACLLSLLLGVILTGALLSTGTERRFLLPAIPSLLYFTAAGASWVAAYTVQRIRTMAGYQDAWAALLLVLALVGSFKPFHKGVFGFSQVANAIVSRPSVEYPAVLIASDAQGEGMFVADMADLRFKTDSITLRSTKVLADMNWMAKDYKTIYTTPRAIVDRVDELPVTYVVDDRSVGEASLFPHQKLLEQAIAEYPQYFQLLGAFLITRDGSPHGAAYLYRFQHSRPPSRVLRLSLVRTLHSEIEVIVPEVKEGKGQLSPPSSRRVDH